MNTTGRKTVKGRTTSAPKTAKTPAPTPASTAVASPAALEKKPPATQEAIAERAYQLYLSRNGEAGHEVEDWLAAETELTTA
jgi:hypothetical protein